MLTSSLCRFFLFYLLNAAFNGAFFNLGVGEFKHLKFMYLYIENIFLAVHYGSSLNLQQYPSILSRLGLQSCFLNIIGQ